MKRTPALSMFVFSVLLTGLMIFCLGPGISYADAPQDLKIKYDSKTKILSVTITHPSSFPGFHHIKNVEVKNNSTVVSNNSYESQPRETPFTYTYKMDAVKGDKLEVTATCNMSGNKSATVIVP